MSRLVARVFPSALLRAWRPAKSRTAARACPYGGVIACAVGLVLALTSATASAQKMDKASQAWFRQYRLLVLPDELKALQQLRDPRDVEEFARIFWARRSADPARADVRTSIEQAKAVADERFGNSGKRGSETACGQVFMLLGNPDEVIGRELQSTFDTRPTRDGAWRHPDPVSKNATRDGARKPELWTYKSKPGRTFLLPGGDLRLLFDDGCEFDEAAKTLDELARIAAERVLHPEIGYEFGADGRLKPLGARRSAVSAARALLDAPRSDFPVTFEMKLQTPGLDGTYVAGVLFSGADALPATSRSAGTRLRVIARATPEAGEGVIIAERDLFALARPDGAFVSSYGCTLPAGRYAMSIAVVEPTSGKGAVASAKLELPDYRAKTLIVGPLVVLPGASAPAADPNADAYAAFVVGGEHMMPQPGNVLAQSESLRLLVLVHNAAGDPTTGKASLRAAFSVLQEGKLVAKGKDQMFETPGVAASVGPIPLAPFAPGRYLARVEITDEVSKTTIVRETPFEVIR